MTHFHRNIEEEKAATKKLDNNECINDIMSDFGKYQKKKTNSDKERKMKYNVVITSVLFYSNVLKKSPKARI